MKNKIIELDSVNSTNDYARSLIEKHEAEDGLVIIAGYQHAGRGQSGNTWESEKSKNLTFSIIRFPSFIRLSEQFLLNKITSLAICDYLRTIIKLKKISIKWPNDIYVDNKKIAGILIENIISGNEICQTVTGIGLNVNQDKFGKNIPNPVSLKLITGKEYGLKKELNNLLGFMNKRYLELKNTGRKNIDAEYLKNLYKYSIQADYKYKDKIIHARITGVSESGRLILVADRQKNIECDFKEIVFL